MFLDEGRVVARFCLGEVFRRQFLPGDQQLVRIRELPDQPAVPVPRRLALAEIQEFLDLPPEAAVALAARACLAQVKYDGGVHPFGGEGGLGQGRVLLLEDACGAFLRKRGWNPSGARTAKTPVPCGIRMASSEPMGRKPANPSAFRPFLVNCIPSFNSTPHGHLAYPGLSTYRP